MSYSSEEVAEIKARVVDDIVRRLISEAEDFYAARHADSIDGLAEKFRKIVAGEKT